MDGILDLSPVGALDPRSMALTQMGLSLLGSSGPSLTPVSFGQSFGQAGMQGIQAFQQAQQANQANALKALQMQHMEQQMRLEQDRANRPQALMSGGPGTVFFDPSTKQPVFTVPQAEKPVSPQSPLGKLNADLQAGLISAEEHAAGLKKLNEPSRPLVTVDNRQPTKFNEEVGKALGEQYAGLMKADFSAPATIGKYQRLGNLLGQVNTGKFAGTTADIKAAAKGLGIDLTSMGVRDDIAPAQAAKALSNQLALELRNPAGGAGMPGAMSDQDREFLRQMIPSIENDPGAIKQMIEYRVKLAKREQEVARKARAYRKRNGTFDEGFFDELQEWSDKNPIFANEKRPAVTPPSSSNVIDFGSLK